MRTLLAVVLMSVFAVSCGGDEVSDTPSNVRDEDRRDVSLMDAGGSDAEADATPYCTIEEELCDNTCVDTSTDPLNCGGCGEVCQPLSGAVVQGCADSACAYACENGRFDLNGDLREPDSDGCEASCQPTGDEICDERDNDCDGTVDEGCACTQGDSRPCGDDEGVCERGKQDCRVDGSWSECLDFVGPTDEICDGLDNDCDGETDEPEDLETGQTCDTGELGACKAGTQECVDGALECVALNEPDVEVCDGIDNDCNGPVDDSPTDVGMSCTTGTPGVCSSGVTVCNGGALICEPDNTASTEVCDGLDNDCNGPIDDNPSDAGGVCDTGNLGACAAGVVICNMGSTSCSQVNTPMAEVCDGVDNDCDGPVDEDDPGGGVSCMTGRQGVCAPGTTTCQNGSVECISDVSATAEVCDGLDNDCDGFVDDGNPGSGSACATGLQGVCSTGTTICQNGGIACQPDETPTTEVCDGLDNDCDGTPDDGDPGGGFTCATGQPGVCAAGTTTCSAGAVVCSANQAPSSDVCDGLDNDCDGFIDQGNPGGGAYCDTGRDGQCQDGTTACTGGAIVCQQDVSSSPEVCDGIDNDCDGEVDEGDPGGGASCVTGQLGACSLGTTVCSGGSVVCVANETPTAEVCDGIDNDCNGSTDEGNPGGGIDCNTGDLGVCADGTTICIGGAILCQQDSSSSPEVCDGLDNDCDGSFDEGNPGGGVACGTGQPGVCSAGTTACTGGSLLCEANESPTTEVCDGLDNDCDGGADELNPGGGFVCNTGLDGQCAAGTTQCIGGALQCAQDTASSNEVCDGVDNDCDGDIDEGDPGGGFACGTGQNGVCSAGTTICSGGSVICERNTAPSGEVCDGLDNDCDGGSDEGNPGGGLSCSTGLQGVCSSGTTLCSDGGITCVQNTSSSAEICDGLDNDCDGGVDEGCPIDVTLVNGRDGTEYGGSGGSSFRTTCPAGQVLDGIDGRTGSRVDQVRGRCKDLSIVENTGTNPYSYTTSTSGTSLYLPSQGGTGGTYRSAFCPAGQYVIGITGRADGEVDRLSVICGYVDFNRSGSSWVDNRSTTVVDLLGGGSGGNAFTFYCPADSVVIGLLGREGSRVDRIGVRCADVSAVLR